MSLLRGETVRVAAQTLGVDDLSEECVRELLPEVELRVREIIQDALKFRAHARTRQLTAQQINLALQTRNMESLYGFGAPGAPKLRQCEDEKTLFFVDDEERNVAELLNAALPPVPVEPALNMHWLAVDGVQPLVAENAAVEDDARKRTSIKDEQFVGRVERKPLVKHVLTEEMQLFYSKVTEAIMSGDAELQRTALASLSRDQGIHQLLPYLTRFVYEEVRHSNHNLLLLTALMRVCRCLLMNPSLKMELYLHQLLPAILTCVLGKQLCENPAEDHWTLREFAAQLIAQICERYGGVYENIQARISMTFHKAITDPHSPFPTQYGALYGMMNLGPLVLEDLLFPTLAPYYQQLEQALTPSNPSPVERLEAQNCLGALVHAAGMYLIQSKQRAVSALRPTTLRDITAMLYEALGERLVPYSNQSSVLDVCL